MTPPTVPVVLRLHGDGETGDQHQVFALESPELPHGVGNGGGCDDERLGTRQLRGQGGKGGVFINTEERGEGGEANL